LDENSQIIRYDVSGYEIVTSALLELLNDFPGLDSGNITFSTLEDSGGIAMYPISSAVIQSEKEDITGHVKQTCLYPFHVIYRASGLSENRKANVKEWLDNLGRWLEKEEIIIRNNSYKLDQYPELTGARKIERIDRQTPSYLDSINDNKSENWVIYITMQYINEFDR